MLIGRMPKSDVLNLFERSELATSRYLSSRAQISARGPGTMVFSVIIGVHWFDYGAVVICNACRMIHLQYDMCNTRKKGKQKAYT